MNRAQGGAASAADETRSIGRGALFLTVTKFWFLASGFVIYAGLTKILGGGEGSRSSATTGRSRPWPRS
ncbi:MAG: hypothetical protein R3F20_08610 [Planctomycetota bacterium]